MVQLVLDTALHIAQAALFAENGECVAHIKQQGEKGQTDMLLPVLREVMQQAALKWDQLSGVAVTVGPGVFTGIRAGIAAARALRLALNIQIQGVNCLQALAAQNSGGRPCLVLIDAHKDEVYAQIFSENLQAPQPPALVARAALAPLSDQAHSCIIYPAALRATLQEIYPEADEMQICETLDVVSIYKMAKLFPLEPMPLYIRAPDALPQINKALKRA